MANSLPIWVPNIHQYCPYFTHLCPLLLTYLSILTSIPPLFLHFFFTSIFPTLTSSTPSFQFPTKWCHQSLLSPLPRFIMQSASGCSWMPLYGLTVSARGQAGEFIHHDSNALSQCSTLQPRPAPEWPGHIQTCLICMHTYTHRKSSSQTSKIVCA